MPLAWARGGRVAGGELLLWVGRAAGLGAALDLAEAVFLSRTFVDFLAFSLDIFYV